MLSQTNLLVKDLDKIECSIFDPKSGIIDQSWHVDIAIERNLDTEEDFSGDYKALTDLVKDTIRSHIGHSLLIPIQSKLIDFKESGHKKSWILNVASNNNPEKSRLTYSYPETGIFPIMAHRITAENVALEVKKILRHRLPNIINNVDIALRPNSSSRTIKIK